MISRTTSIGLVLALCYLFYSSKLYAMCIAFAAKRVLVWFIGILLIIIPLIIYFYNTSPEIHANLRFAFEGFFSWVETGEWEIGSNEKLKTMYVYPETLKTWIIGDGYIVNPSSDPDYKGPIYEGYYMGTDVGYLRFIFYFGLVGLAIISMFIYISGKICIKKNPAYKWLFILLLVINYIVWFKVSTDIFSVLALLFLINSEENRVYSERIGL